MGRVRASAPGLAGEDRHDCLFRLAGRSPVAGSRGGRNRRLWSETRFTGALSVVRTVCPVALRAALSGHHDGAEGGSPRPHYPPAPPELTLSLKSSCEKANAGPSASLGMTIFLQPLFLQPLFLQPLFWQPLFWQPLFWQPFFWQPLLWQPLLWAAASLAAASLGSRFFGQPLLWAAASIRSRFFGIRFLGQSLIEELSSRAKPRDLRFPLHAIKTTGGRPPLLYSYLV